MFEFGHPQVGNRYEIGSGFETLGLLQQIVHGLHIGITAVIQHATHYAVDALLQRRGKFFESLGVNSPPLGA